MKDNRLQENPSNQNKELFEILHITHCYPAWNAKGIDYYLKRSDYLPTGFVLSKTKLHYKLQIGITIKPGQDWCRTILESIDWNKYLFRSVAQYTVGGPEVQRAFNEKRKEMGL